MNTRFNPTANGFIHLGHLYLAKVNEYVAHSSGGNFILRFDDNQKAWVNLLGWEKISEYCNLIEKDLEWAGVVVDDVYHQRDWEAQILNMSRAEGFDYPEPEMYDEVPIAIQTSAPQYPFAPWLTFEKVVLDQWEEIDTIIRGEDLIGEYSLYKMIEVYLGYRSSKHYYLPRLKAGGNNEMDNVSKTNGTYKISTLRDSGMSYVEMDDILRRSCLKDPAGVWSPENVKMEPRLII